MVNDWVRDAALATMTKVWGCTSDAITDNDPATGLRHVENMLHRIYHGEITGTKAHRWLGWAQAIICVGGGATLDELKAINKAASLAATSTRGA
jgi:UDP-N-acetylglucosamine:LPS N-acetylglucosamine transferase